MSDILATSHAESPSQRDTPVRPVRPVPRALWILLGVAVLVVFLKAQKDYDDVNFWHYITTCAHDGRWEDIYDKENNQYALASYGNLSMNVMLYPLGYLPMWGMRLTITVMILALWYAMYRFMSAGIEDRRFGFRGWVPLAAGAPILAMILAGRYLLNDLDIKQLNMITFMGGVLGMSLMMVTRRRRQQVLGVVLLAASIGLKLTTVPLLAMLLIKRAWRQAAAVAALSVGFLWGLPYLAMGPEVHGRLSQRIEGNTLNMWMQVKDTTCTWSFTNFLHYRTFVRPLWPGLENTAPAAFQLVCLAATFLIGLPVLYLMRRCDWREMNAMRLWEEIALVGVAWSLIDPDGRTAHFVAMVPAFGLIIYRRLEAWHTRGEAPRPWQWALFLVVCAANLWLLRLRYPVRHYYYMHIGLFSLGMFTLYALTILEVVWADRRARGVAAASAGHEPSGRSLRTAA